MAITPVPIHKALYTDAYNILLLADGFLVQQETEFLSFCKTLAKEFFKINPFKACKNNINIFAHFTPSIEQGITNQARNTAYQIYFDDEDSVRGTLNSAAPRNIKNIVEQIEFNVDGIQRKLNGADTWLNANSKSYGAIGIIANSKLHGGVTRPGNVGIGAILAQDWYYFIVTQFGYVSQEGGYQYIFAHELGHAIRDYVIKPDGNISTEKTGLAEEYENIAESYPANGEEPLEYNITAIKTVNTQGVINFNNLKWKKLMTKRELENIQVIRKQNQAVDEAYYFEKDNYDWNKIQLIEGGYCYATGIFRSNLDCKMRREYDRRTAYPVPGTNLKQYYSGPDFCRVCRYHIIKAITGKHSFSIQYPLPENIRTIMDEKNMIQRLITSLVNHINVKDGSLINTTFIDKDDSSTYSRILHRNCARATADLAIMLSQVNIDWHELRFGVASDHSYLCFYNMIIDPTIFQFYQNIDYPNRSSEIKFTYSLNGVEYDIPNIGVDANGIGFSRGFVGTVADLKDFYWYFRPVAARWVDLSDHHPLVTDYIHLNEILDPYYVQPSYMLDEATNTIKAPTNHPNKNLITDIQDQLVAYKRYKELLNTNNPEWKINDVNRWPEIKAMFDPLNFSIREE